MRRLLIVLIAIGATSLGAQWPVAVQAAPSAPVDAGQGSVGLAVGPDTSYGSPTWTMTLTGQFSVDGNTYDGVVTGSGQGGRSGEETMDLTGTSSTAAVRGNCTGGFVE